MKPIKSTVYLPVNGDYLTAVCHFEHTEWCHHETVQSNEGYFFTPEQLNEYTANVIQQTLEIAAEKATVTPIDHEEISEGSFRPIWGVEDDSITNTFEETFKKFEV